MTTQQKQAVERVLESGGPHEWGYRDLTDGTFIRDDTPFYLADALNEARRWNHIDTAPKDKTIIGCDFSRDGRGRIARIWWQPEFDAWISGARVMTMVHGYTVDGKSEKLHSPDIEYPTHWIPCPDRPK